jgi:UDP-N-acetylglucosamine 2-epimerase (non-hydrolysing)
MRHLATEGLAERSVLVGDVMVDICLAIADAVRAGDRPLPVLPGGLANDEPYLIATLHRAENTDDPERLASLVTAMASLPVPVALLAHPRLVAKAEEYGLTLAQGAVRVGKPLDYAGLVAAVKGSVGVVTDSGGLQKEAYLLAKPCTTLRPETEWVETLVDGWNHLVPDPAARGAEWAAIATRPAPDAVRTAPFGDGKTADRVVDVLSHQRRR